MTTYSHNHIQGRLSSITSVHQFGRNSGKILEKTASFFPNLSIPSGRCVTWFFVKKNAKIVSSISPAGVSPGNELLNSTDLEPISENVEDGGNNTFHVDLI